VPNDVIKSRSALRTALWYAALAVAWIVLSDTLVAVSTHGFDFRLRLDLLKGLAFVFVTSLLLFWLLRRWQRQMLAQARNLYATLAAMPDLLFEVDLNGRYFDYHSPRTELLAAPPAVFIGKTLHEVMPPDVAEIGMTALREAHANGFSQGKQIELRLPDGLHWFELSVARKTTDAGETPRFIVLSRDITAHKLAEATVQRMNKLYAALSQCNQAIVRCHNEAELFPIICRDAVNFGGMKMAWIGMLDETGQKVKPVASFGAGIEYLEGLDITLDPALPSGRGPTGTAMRENQPFWGQDFQHDPATAAWHERGARFGWGASASLPLHRQGKVVGAFNLYAGMPYDFDEAARNLLAEMSMDISFALDRFALKIEHRHIHQQLQESEVRYRTAFYTSPDSININHLEDGLYLDVNAGFERISGWQRDEVIGKTSSEINIWHNAADRQRLVEALRRDGFCENLEAEFVLKDGRIITGLMSARVIEIDGVPCLLNITRDISEQKQTRAKITQLAYFDQLTGLPNRSLLNERFSYAFSLAQRSGAPLAVMFLDLDHFKNINDTLGHSIGDQFLIEVAQRLKAALREEDTVSRLGGDEFILVFPGTDADGAAIVASKLIETVSKPYMINEHELIGTPSIGIAIYPDDGNNLEVLLKNADAAMYRVKRDSRNDFRFFTAEMQAHSERNLQLVNALRHALARNELVLHYQPQVAMNDGRIIGAEALLRWQHPELGMISPAEFIPIAEDSGQIIAIGEWVLRTAVNQVKTWQRNGLPAMVIAVNLSAIQFRQPDLPELVSRILDEAQLAPEYLELELTEAVAMDDPQTAVSIMDKLFARGIRMSIDDFGTGYSSLSYLKRFKVYKLKIDQSFVRNISDNPEDKAIVTTIINLASSLGMHTVAEGVETAGQLAFLRLQGCDEVQGYYFSKPLPKADFESFVDKQP